MDEMLYTVDEHENGKEFFVRDPAGNKIGFGLFSYPNYSRALDLAIILNTAWLNGKANGLATARSIMTGEYVG